MKASYPLAASARRSDLETVANSGATGAADLFAASGFGLFGAGPAAWRAMTVCAESAWRAAAAQNRAFVDAQLYDLGALTASERRRLAAMPDAPGGVVLVQPSGVESGATGGVRRFADAAEALAAAQAISAERVGLAVARRDASLLGVAAFARNVADGIGAPTLAVAPADETRPHGFDGAFDRWFGGGFGGGFGVVDGRAPGGFDAAFEGDRDDVAQTALVAVLEAADESLDVLVGHSDGAHLLADALFAARAASRLAPGDARRELAAQVITLGAAPALPKRCDASHVIGACDAYGWCLSDSAEPVDHIPLAVGHHTNRRLPGHLDVSASVRRLVRTAAAPAASPVAPTRRAPDRTARPTRRQMRRVEQVIAEARDRPRIVRD